MVTRGSRFKLQDIELTPNSSHLLSATTSLVDVLSIGSCLDPMPVRSTQMLRRRLAQARGLHIGYPKGTVCRTMGDMILRSTSHIVIKGLWPIAQAQLPDDFARSPRSGLRNLHAFGWQTLARGLVRLSVHSFMHADAPATPIWRRCFVARGLSNGE